MNVSKEPSAVDVTIKRELDLSKLSHLDEESASSEDGILANHAYVDLRNWSTEDVAMILDEERDLLDALAVAGWTTDEAVEVLDEHFSDWSELSGLDAGIGGAVYALSAAGATPISSCNGGTIGLQHHSSDVPHILFSASDRIQIDAIQRALQAANLGSVANEEFGEIYADQVLKFHQFARALLDELSKD